MKIWHQACAPSKIEIENKPRRQKDGWILENLISKIRVIFFGPGTIFSRIFLAIHEDILRIRIEQIIAGPFNEFSDIWPQLSDKDRKNFGQYFSDFLDEIPELSYKEYKALAIISPMCVQIVWPKITEKNSKVLFKLVLQEIRDRGKLFDKL